MGIIVYFLLWVLQDLYHQPKGLTIQGSGLHCVGPKASQKPETLAELLAKNTLIKARVVKMMT